MVFEPSGLTLSELAERTKFKERTIRYYIALGLLPPPEGTGPRARYGSGHIGRLRLIRLLQSQHLPLTVIMKILAQRPESEIEQAADESPLQGGSALGYVQSLLGSKSKLPLLMLTSSGVMESRAVEREARSHWERIQITPDIELHVRRPLSKPDNRRLELLLRRIREIFPEGDVR